jgi:hypothetical protein
MRPCEIDKLSHGVKEVTRSINPQSNPAFRSEAEIPAGLPSNAVVGGRWRGPRIQGTHLHPYPTPRNKIIRLI